MSVARVLASPDLLPFQPALGDGASGLPARLSSSAVCEMREPETPVVLVSGVGTSPV